MDFSVFQNLLPKLKETPLDGLEAQFKLAPALRLQYNAQTIAAKNPKIAATMALFYEKNGETYFLLTLRAKYNGTHSNQISFPGGKKDKNDLNLKATALRETFEEVGIPSEDIKIIKEMTATYIPPSNFLVTPFIGYTQKTPVFKANHEVAKIIEISLKQLLEINSISKVKISNSYANNITVPCFNLNGFNVWGATAMMLSEIKMLFAKL